MTHELKKTTPVLSMDEGSYLSLNTKFFWVWHRMYSVLRGNSQAACPLETTWSSEINGSFISVMDCDTGESRPLDSFARNNAKALSYIEVFFRGRLHIEDFTILLVPRSRAYLHRYWHISSARNINVEIAVRYDPETARRYEVEAVRSASHEIYHLAMAAIDRAERNPYVPDNEELRATLFSSCVEMFVYGRVGRGAIEDREQGDPSVVRPNTPAHDSLAGGLASARMLQTIAGPDKQISGIDEEQALIQICSKLR